MIRWVVTSRNITIIRNEIIQGPVGLERGPPIQHNIADTVRIYYGFRFFRGSLAGDIVHKEFGIHVFYLPGLRFAKENRNKAHYIRLVKCMMQCIELNPNDNAKHALAKE